ncbi:MAG: hypothetical protein K6E63_10265 [Lachnospiraceae bacterium]|nr:hypothetical protein [Lachnospiraceae bacterium]
MNRKLIALLGVFTLAVACLTGCGKKEADKPSKINEPEQVEEQEDAGEQENEVGMGNPWVEITEAEANELCARLFKAPDGAASKIWQKCESLGDPDNYLGPLIQLDFELDGMEFTARAQQGAAEDADISGIYAEWTDGPTDLTLANWGEGHMAGKSYRAIDDEGYTDLITWYDIEIGIMYSLSVTSPDLDGFDIQAIAEQMYAGEPVAVEDDPHAVFQEILYRYKEAQDMGYTMDQVIQMGLETELVQHGWPMPGTEDNIKYLYYDIDGNGQDELIIKYYGDVSDIWGYDGSAVNMAFSTPYRGIATLYPDGVLNLLFSISASDSRSTWYKYDASIADYIVTEEKSSLEPLEIPAGDPLNDIVLPADREPILKPDAAGGGDPLEGLVAYDILDKFRALESVKDAGSIYDEGCALGSWVQKSIGRGMLPDKVKDIGVTIGNRYEFWFGTDISNNYEDNFPSVYGTYYALKDYYNSEGVNSTDFYNSVLQENEYMGNGDPENIKKMYADLQKFITECNNIVRAMN